GFHFQRPDWPDHPGAGHLGHPQCAEKHYRNRDEDPLDLADYPAARARPDHLGHRGAARQSAL
ncbi:hypothetical protein, partial [Pseudomonas sp. FEN]